MALNLVEFDGANNPFGLISSRVPWPTSPFPYFLHNGWYCCPFSSITGSSMLFGPESFFTVTVASAPHATVCSIFLSQANPTPNRGFFQGSFALPKNVLWNVIVSVNCLTQTVQVYCNDAPCALVTGGFTAASQLQCASTNFTSLDLGTSGQKFFPAVADIWESNMPTFVDLTVTSNRRKFINADLTNADLGANGQTPFGFIPPVFLTAPSSPSQFPTNFGSGGPFTVGSGLILSYQAAGVCPAPPTPPPPPPPPPRQCSPWAI